MSKYTVLAVDDEPLNLDLVELAFSDIEGVELLFAHSGDEALEQMRSHRIDVILLDLRMPGMSGLELLKKIKSDPKTKDIPVIIVTANSEEKNHALKLGANDFLAKPLDPEELKLRALNQAELYRHRRTLDRLVDERTRQLERALEFAKASEYEIALRLGKASEFRDIETGMHIKRMSLYSALLGHLYGLPKEEEELLRYSAALHDVGKIGIPDSILLKPGRLEPHEFEIMKQHTTIGGMMLEGGDQFPILKAGRIIALQHHEKYDGSGYPKGLKGEEIHLYGRIVAIVDVFDALYSKRIYKEPFSLEKTLQIMQEGRGTHFDPDLLDLFFDHLDKFLDIRQEFPDQAETPPILTLLEEYR